MTVCSKTSSFFYKRPKVTLLVILVFAAGVRLSFFTGLGSIDSLAYTKAAYEIAQGTFEVSSYVHKLRLGLILPTSLVYRFWEVNEFSSALYPFLCSLGSVILIFYLAQLLFEHAAPGLVSALLLAVFPMEIFLTSQLMTEIPLSFLMALCVYTFLKGEQITEKRGINWYYIISGMIAGFAYMTKIFAVFLALFFLCYILYRRRLSTAYLWMTLGLCCVLLPEMMFYYTKTGDPLHRITSIVLSPGSGAEPNPGGMYRNDLFLYPYYWFVSLYHFGFFYYFIVFAFLYSLWNTLKKTYIPMLWAGSVFLYLQFGREGKHLIHKEARFLSIITIPCLLVLGYVLFRISSRKRGTLILCLTIGFLSLSSLIFISFKQTLTRSEFENLRAATRDIEQLPQDIDIYTDNNSLAYLHYFVGYRMQKRLKAFNVHNYATGENSYPVDLHQLHRAVVIVNWHMINTLRYKGFKRIKYPEIIYNPPSHWKVVHTITPQNSWLYQSLMVLRDFPLLDYLPTKITQKILKTTNRLLKTQAEKTIIYRISQ